MLHQNAFDRCTALTGILVGTADRQAGRFVEIGIVHDDQRIVAAQFQYHAPITDTGSDVFADGHPAGKRHQVDGRIGQQFIGNFCRVAGDDLKHFRWQTGFVKDVGQQQCRERYFFRGLQQHAVVGGDRGDDLVRDLVHRVVERGDRRNHTRQRVALGVDAPLTTVRGDVAGEYLAIVAQGGIGTENQHIAHAACFVAAVLPAQTGLAGDQRTDFLDAIDDDLRGTLENAGTLVTRQAWFVSQGNIESTPYIIDAGFRNRTDACTGKWIMDFDVTIAIHFFAADTQAFLAKIH